MSTDRFKIEFLREALDYRNGALYWRTRPAHHFSDAAQQKTFNTRQAGEKAGSPRSGYLYINFKSGPIAAHRVIFALHYGYFPKVVDHINGVPLDNRIENLRAASHAQNIRNMRTSRRNTSGIKGVGWHKAARKWFAHIGADGKLIWLGLFESITDATAARKTAEAKYFGEFSNDR